MKQALAYSLKVWLTSAVIGSIISYLPFVDLADVAQTLPYVLFQILAALLLSVGCCLLLMITTCMLARRGLKTYQFKLSLSLIGLFLAIAQLLIVTRTCCGVDWADRLTFIAYPLMVVVSIWLFRLESLNRKVNTFNL